MRERVFGSSELRLAGVVACGKTRRWLRGNHRDARQVPVSDDIVGQPIVDAYGADAPGSNPTFSFLFDFGVRHQTQHCVRVKGRSPKRALEPETRTQCGGCWKGYVATPAGIW